MTISTITSKGQTTIPKKIRQYLNLQPQQQTAFEPKDGYVIIRPIDISIERFAGILSGKKPAGSKTDERKAASDMLGKGHKVMSFDRDFKKWPKLDWKRPE